jgi:putative peptide zinc metalloprotease protein
MTESLFSANWFHVAQLKPRLREAVIIKRQHWRNQLWYLLIDEISGRQHRVNTSAYQFIGRCNGKLSVQQVWDSLLLEHEDHAPTQDEVVDLLINLNQFELIQNEQSTDIEGLFDRRNQRQKQKIKSYLNPLMIRLPLGDPNAWLKKLDRFAQIIFRPITFLLWLSLIMTATLIAGSEWHGILMHADQHMLSTRYLTLSFICFPVIKALHELSHGLAVRKWGGEVHEFGISFLVFIPAPYVDATAANSFQRKTQRMAVSAAGIILETTLAALALLVWINTQPSLLREIAFVTMVIGSVSTFLFNGNPLLKFDGYYVLSDFLDIPNLASRSQQYWQLKLKRFFSISKPPAMEIAEGEKKWLILYTPLSFLYRILIAIVISVWLGAKWFLLGLLAATYMGFSQLIRPIYKWANELIASGKPGKELTRIRRNLSIVGACLLLFFFIIPLPFSTVAPAVTWLPEQAQIRPEESGFIHELPIKNGELVSVGDLLAVIENPKLIKKRAQLLGVLDGLRADQFQYMINNPENAQNIHQKIQNVENELLHINEQIDHLKIFAQVDGKLVMPKQEDVLGAYVKRGQNMGYVFENTEIRIKAAIAEKDAYFVRNMTNNIHVWLVEHPEKKYPTKMLIETPAATRVLPSPALGDSAGGPFLTDLSDKDGTRLLEPIFIFDLKLMDSTIERIGGRAFVRFEHNPTPLATQLYQRANQLFLSKFEPSA